MSSIRSFFRISPDSNPSTQEKWDRLSTCRVSVGLADRKATGWKSVLLSRVRGFLDRGGTRAYTGSGSCFTPQALKEASDELEEAGHCNSNQPTGRRQPAGQARPAPARQGNSAVRKNRQIANR